MLFAVVFTVLFLYTKLATYILNKGLNNVLGFKEHKLFKCLDVWQTWLESRTEITLFCQRLTQYIGKILEEQTVQKLHTGPLRGSLLAMTSTNPALNFTCYARHTSTMHKT